jgi:hypothetical protein
VHPEAKLPGRQGRASASTLIFGEYIQMHMFFLNEFSGYTLKMDYVRESYARISEYCAKPTSNRKLGLGTKTLGSFSSFNVIKLLQLQRFIMDLTIY